MSDEEKAISHVRPMPPPAEPRGPVITLVRNGKAHLETTIQSVLEQTYENIEYIVIDGASTDGTIDIIKRYDDRIDYWLSEPDDGIYDAMNRLRSLLRGNVMRADLTPQQVERINAALLTAVAAIESEMQIQPSQQEKN